jgi:AbiTii-like protein
MITAWAKHELDGYLRRDEIPEYRIVQAQIYWDVLVPYHGTVTHLVNVEELPEPFRQHVARGAVLNHPIDELEALVDPTEANRDGITFEVDQGSLYLSYWNKANRDGQRALVMYWRIHPASIRGAVGRVRTALVDFVARLDLGLPEGDELPTTAQAEEAFQSTVSLVISNSDVTITTASTKEGDIMTQSPHTIIKNNKTDIKNSSGNVTVASAHVAQANGDGIDMEKVHQFTDFLSQIMPTLGLSVEQQTEVESGVNELTAATAGQNPDTGRFRNGLSRVLKALGVVGKSAAQQVAVSMGDELVRELGEEIVRELPH